jgi:hypothetical protein
MSAIGRLLLALRRLWDGFTGPAGRLASRVIGAVSEWLGGIADQLREGDIIVTSGRKSWHYRREDFATALQVELGRCPGRTILELPSEREELELYRAALGKTHAAHEHTVEMTPEETELWDGAVGKEKTVLLVTAD